MAHETIDCGCCSSQSDRRSVAIVLSRDELLYDIGNNCYIEGDILPEDTQHSRHMVQDATQEGNVDRITRILDLAHADITERLFPFTRSDIAHPLVDDRLRKKPAYGFFLEVPADFSQSTLNLLGKLMHELLVCNATADWMSITNPPKEEMWKRKALEVMDRIGKIRFNRQGRRRITPHWL